MEMVYVSSGYSVEVFPQHPLGLWNQGGLAWINRDLIEMLHISGFSLEVFPPHSLCLSTQCGLCGGQSQSPRLQILHLKDHFYHILVQNSDRHSQPVKNVS